MNINLLETLPTSIVFVLIAIIMMAFGEAGYQYGARSQNLRDKGAPISLSSMVGALLGMLAFVLAFTFSMASSQNDLRKQNVLSEANSIGTAYLRSDLIDEQYGMEVKRLLREYIDIRLKGTNIDYLETAIVKSIEIHELLWTQVALAANENPNTNTMLMIQSINEVIDMHEKRIVGAIHNRIPTSVWIALIAITSLTMITLGIQIGITGKRRLGAVIPLILAFAVLVTLVADLNSSQSGLMKVGQHAILDLQNTINQGMK